MPCPKCEAPILGNPATCPACGHPLRAAAPAQANPFAYRPVAVPIVDEVPVEHHQQVAAGPVVPEPVEGLIDSRLFGAFVPAGVDAPPIEGLEVTAQPVGAVPDDKVPGLETTTLADKPARANLADASPVDGLIDSRLFGAFVPEGVDAPMLEGLEVTRYDAFEAPAPRPAAAATRKNPKDDAGAFEGFCVGCGVNVQSRICPMCGNPARPRGG